MESSLKMELKEIIPFFLNPITLYKGFKLHKKMYEVAYDPNKRKRINSMQKKKKKKKLLC